MILSPDEVSDEDWNELKIKEKANIACLKSIWKKLTKYKGYASETTKDSN